MKEDDIAEVDRDQRVQIRRLRTSAWPVIELAQGRVEIITGAWLAS